MTVQIPGQPGGKRPGSGPGFGGSGPGGGGLGGGGLGGGGGQVPPPRLLEVGDLLPPMSFTSPGSAGFEPLADDQAGKLHVLLFLAGPDKPKSAKFLKSFADRHDALKEAGAHVQIVLTTAEATDLAASGRTLPFPVLSDKGSLGEGRGFAHVGIGVTYGRVLTDRSMALAIGPNLHVLALADGDAKGNPAEAILARAKPLTERRKGGLITQSLPPVLVIPDVFDAEDCKRLIQIYKTTGQEFVEPGHNQLQGRTTDVKMRIPEYGRNDRIDHWVCSEETNRVIDRRLVPRLMPEIQKAFNYKVTRHERYRIACYEGARGGSEHGHRDNTQPFVAHRRFAVTINLNSEDYEGAELKFPEFGDAVFKPPSGAAIVFSCSLLHEVMAMRSGARFALLAFLFGET